MNSLKKNMSKEEPAHVLNTGVGGGANSLQTFCKLEEKTAPWRQSAADSWLLAAAAAFLFLPWCQGVWERFAADPGKRALPALPPAPRYRWFHVRRTKPKTLCGEWCEDAEGLTLEIADSTPPQPTLNPCAPGLICPPYSPF